MQHGIIPLYKGVFFPSDKSGVTGNEMCGLLKSLPSTSYKCALKFILSPTVYSEFLKGWNKGPKQIKITERKRLILRFGSLNYSIWQTQDILNTGQKNDFTGIYFLKALHSYKLLVFGVCILQWKERKYFPVCVCTCTFPI